MADKKPTGSITFISYDKPAITDGVHELTVSQSFLVGTDGLKSAETTQTIKIAALGPRFSLEPQLVTGKYPPDKSIGEYRAVLPHLVFKRSILPWERKISKTQPYDDAPWLALLLFTKDENIVPTTTTVAELRSHPGFPAFDREPAQQDSDRLLVIDVPGSLLQKTLPAREGLPYMAHVRKSADQSDAPEYAILVSARLPQAGNECVVHLVSLENRTDLFDTFDAKQTYRLVTLSSWSFAATKNDVTFTELLLTACDNTGKNTASKNVLRMPAETANTTVNSLYSQGFVPLPHQTKQGNKLVSWFRGPLLPGPGREVVDFTNLKVTAADQIVRYDSNLGMFDVSYAAAWELGRLLMLRRRRISVEFFNWKRASQHSLQPIKLRHLPFAQRSGSVKLPPAVNDWFVGLGKLSDVPYNYLVPDERELPQPSIRFFSVDPAWLAYLLDGAFSIGRVVSNRPGVDDSLRPAIPLPGPMSGFLLRSPVVAGWPHMEVTGYNVAGGGTSFRPDGATDANVLEILRMERIAHDTLFCLFAGELKTLDLNEKAEVIHFGVAYEDGQGASKSPCYYKVLRDLGTGDEYSVDPSQVNVCQSDPSGHWVTVPFTDATSGLIDMPKLKDAIKTARQKQTLAPNEFAFEMVEGVGKVRIVREG